MWDGCGWSVVDGCLEEDCVIWTLSEEEEEKKKNEDVDEKPIPRCGP